MEDKKPHYVDILDALNNLADLIMVCSLAQENAADKKMPMFVLNCYGAPELHRIAEMAKQVYEE